MSDSLVPDNDDETIVHDNEDIVPGGSQDRKCPWCPKIFLDASSLKKHLENYHVNPPSEHSHSQKREGSGRLLCAKRDCGMTLVSYEALGRHCTDEHGFVSHCETLRFENMDHFKAWLAHLATISGDMVKRRGERKTAEGIIMGDYHCIFDGKKRETRPTRAPDRAPYNRRVPSKKLGFACPAFIRYQVHLDETVTIRSQLQHFGHDVKPNENGELSKSGRRMRNMERGKDIRRGYSFDGLNYDEVDSQSFIDEEGIEIDNDGMVNLCTFSPLERARYRANSSCASMDIALLELGGIPQENLQGVGQLIEKLHEISEAANMIESLVKELASVPNPLDHSLIMDDDSTKGRARNKHFLHMNRKESEVVDMKEVVSDDHHSRLDVGGCHEEEEDSFEPHSESGELEYHEDTIAEEIIVDDEDDYIKEREENGEMYGKISK